MKKNFLKKAISFISVFAVTLGTAAVPAVYAEEALSNENAGTNNTGLFDEYIEKLGDITFEIQKLEYYNGNNEYDEEIASLVAEKEQLIQQHDLYGASTLDDETARDIIVNADYSLSNKARNLSLKRN